MSGVTNVTKTTIPSMTNTAKYRIPDQLTETALIEVKNVQYLRYTNQIKDFHLYTKSQGLDFIIKIRPGAKLAQQLQDLVDLGEIIILPIPGL